MFLTIQVMQLKQEVIPWFVYVVCVIIVIIIIAN